MGAGRAGAVLPKAPPAASEVDGVAATTAAGLLEGREVPADVEGKAVLVGPAAPARDARTVRYRKPYLTLGSMYELSVYSFQLITAMPSGDVARASDQAAVNVSPFRRSTVLVPPFRRASNPTAAGASQSPPALWTAWPRALSLDA